MSAAAENETPFPGRGVYPLLDIETCLERDIAPLALVDRWLDLGLEYCQLRAKHLAERDYLELAARVRSHAPGMQLIANDFVAALDRPDLFCGLHLGQGDLAALRDQGGVERLAERRARRPGFMLGISTHNYAQFAAALARETLWSYTALGPCFSRAGKRGATESVLGTVGVEKILRAAAPAQALRKESAPPCVVFIGGLTAATYAPLARLAQNCGFRPTAAVIGAAFRQEELQQFLTIPAAYNG